MRVALFSDVHGNLTALEAILNELDRRGPFDVIVCAGDLVYLGPSPEEVVERLQQSDVICLRGNCEGIVSGQIPVEQPTPEAGRILQAHKEWTAYRLTPNQLQWLAELPVEHRISPPVGLPDETETGHSGATRSDRSNRPQAAGTGEANVAPDDRTSVPGADLLVVHATPRSFHDPAALCRPDLPEDEARAVFSVPGVQAVAFGHLHGHFVRPCGDLTLVNVSSGSITPDRLSEAAFTIATWHETAGTEAPGGLPGEPTDPTESTVRPPAGHWTFEQYRAFYDPTPELERLHSRDMPPFGWWNQLR